MSKKRNANKYENVRFYYVRDYFDDQPATLAVICTGKTNTEYDGKVGVSICGHKDQFNSRIGKAIAFNRLMNNAPIPIIGKEVLVRKNGKSTYKLYDSYFIQQYKDDPYTMDDINNYIALIVHNIKQSAIAKNEALKSLTDSFIAEMSK